jgi:hypothetical protein
MKLISRIFKRGKGNHMDTFQSQPCPKKEVFVRAFMGELNGDEEKEFLCHLTHCGRCRRAFEALTELQADLEFRETAIPEVALSHDDVKGLLSMSREQVRTYSRRRRAAVPRPVRVAAALAAALVLVVLGTMFLVKIPVSRQAVRGAARPAELKLHSPGGKLKEAPRVFSWSEVKDSDSYHFAIIDAALDTIYETGLVGTELQLPEEVRLRLQRQEPYLWTIVAQDDEGRELASASRYFEIE